MRFMRSFALNAFLLTLVIVLGALQYTLWYGHGGRHDVAHTKAQIKTQEHTLEALRLRNSKLAAEVMDLKQGTEAIEEIARNDMGMIKEGEIFYQFIESDAGHDKPPQHAHPTP